MVSQNRTALYMGIDGGGTKCRVRIEAADGTLLGTGIGGTANPSHGLATVIHSITTATECALAHANLDVSQMKNLVVGAGIAGLHLPQYQQLMSSWQHPFKMMFLTDDLNAATLGAHQGNDGAVVIVGTGFSALSIVNGKKLAIGGHGFLMADQCSGSWIGHQAVQAALLAEDSLAMSTQLTQMLAKKYKARGLMLADALVSASACEYGALAPLVFAAANNNDIVANDILTNTALFIDKVLKVILKSKPPRVSLMGGISDLIVNRLDKELLPSLLPPLKSPEQGAIYYAKIQEKLNASDLFAMSY